MSSRSGSREPDRPEDDDEGIEVFAAGTWPPVSPLATLWGTNATLGERPDWATAAAFLTTAMERHRSATEAFAKALLTDASIAELNSATADLEGSIVSLGLARTMLATDLGSFGVAAPQDDHDDADDADDADDPDETEWYIGFAEPAEYADDILPPLFELPVSVALNVSILDTDDTTVRVRDAHVYGAGLLVTVDVVVRRAQEMPPHDRMELEQALLDVLDEDASDDDESDNANAPSSLISSSPRSTTRACVAQWEYWVPARDHRMDEIRLRNPLESGDNFWLVPVDGDLIDEARYRVIDLSADR